MSELDYWVTEYEGRVCDEPSYHIYRCIKSEGFDPEQMFVGAEWTIDGAVYQICGVEDAECGDGTWHLVYAHYLPKSMSESEWNGLYGNTELANTG